MDNNGGVETGGVDMGGWKWEGGGKGQGVGLGGKAENCT